MTYPVFASGDVLNASDMNAVGLWLVKTQTIGSAVSSVTVTSAFSADYDNYLITVSGGVASTSNALSLTLGSTATGYYYGGTNTTFAASSAADGVANGTSWVNVVLGSTNSLHGMIYLFDPFNAKSTHATWTKTRSATNGTFGSLGGYLANTTSYTAFTLTADTGNVTGGTIRIYGFRN